MSEKVADHNLGPTLRRMGEVALKMKAERLEAQHTALLAALASLVEKLRAANLPTFDLSYNPLTCEKVDAYQIVRYEDVQMFLTRRADELAALLKDPA